MITSKNALFQPYLVWQIRDCHQILSIKTSPGVVSVSDYESWLILHSKQDTVNCDFFIICLEKCDFLQTTSNPYILYTESKLTKRRIILYQFQIRVIIDDRKMAIQSRGSHTHSPLTIFLANHWQSQGGSGSSWPEEPHRAAHVPVGG